MPSDERYAWVVLSTSVSKVLLKSASDTGTGRLECVSLTVEFFVDWTLIYGLPDVRIRGFSKFPTLETGVGAGIPAHLMRARIVFACATRATDSNVAFKFAQEDIFQRKSVCKAGLKESCHI
jgi:hypothetical protein